MRDEFHEEQGEERHDDDGGDPEVPFRDAVDGAHDKPDSRNETQAPNQHPRAIVGFLKPTITWIWEKLVINDKFWIVLATFVIAGATIRYTVYARRQWKALNDQFPLLKRSADAATSAAEIANNTLADQKAAFQIEQRPYLVLDGPPQFLAPPAANSEIQADITLKNIGRTPAFRVIWEDALIEFKPSAKTPAGYVRLRQFLIHHYKRLEGKISSAQKELSTFPLGMHAEQDLAPEATLFSTSQEQVILSTNEFSALQTVGGSFTLFDIGVADYRDSFGKEYETDFCYVYWGPDPRTWHICDSHNTIR